MRHKTNTKSRVMMQPIRCSAFLLMNALDYSILKRIASMGYFKVLADLVFIKASIRANTVDCYKVYRTQLRI